MISRIDASLYIYLDLAITETYNSFDHANVCNLTEINEYNDYARNMAIEVIKSHTN